MSTESLEDLRREIDRIDDALHDLVMQRAQVVERIGVLKGGVQVLRPGREAEILRRLVSRHQGRFPRAVLVRLWREMMGALVALQSPFPVAVFMPERGAGYLELARDQYGAYAATTPYRSVGQVVRAVADGVAAVGIVPVPDREGAENWWLGLTSDNPDTPRIVARLPFAGPGPGRGDGAEALAIGRLPHDATGYDRSWIAVETDPDISRARLKQFLGAAGLEPSLFAATHRADDAWMHLVEILGWVAPDDRRMGRLVEKSQPIRRSVVLGGYAVPFTAEDLAD
ncbi:MAG: chorismate mutase [Alphaproteobacteria bacterium]|nr:chorismate mutase [Alphaproteobacteria bacterium]